MLDVLIIGAGPAGIFTALELLRNNSGKKILIAEQGSMIDKRSCPKAKTGKCVHCKPTCHITSGFAGAGAFSDGKLSLSYEVGGDLPELIGADYAQKMIDYTDKIYLEFGADTHVEGLEATEEIKDIRRKAIQADLKLVDCPIRHLGTEKAHELYLFSPSQSVFFPLCGGVLSLSHSSSSSESASAISARRSSENSSTSEEIFPYASLSWCIVIPFSPALRRFFMQV